MSIASSIGFQFLSSRPLRLTRTSAQAARVGTLLLIVILLNAVDLAYTLYAYRMNMLAEVNPLANNFVRLDFTQGLVCYKLVMVFSGSVMLWKLRASQWTSVGCWLLVLVYSGLAVVWYMWVKDISSSDVNGSYEMLALMAPMRHIAH